LKSLNYGAISSQAAQEWVEGSTTRTYYPERIMKSTSAGVPNGNKR